VVGTRFGYAFPFNSIADFDLPGPNEVALGPTEDGNVLPLGQIDTDLTLPLSERYFLGGLGQFQLRGFRARSVGPRRAILIDEFLTRGAVSGEYIPVGRRRVWIDRRTGEIVEVDPLTGLPPGSEDNFFQSTVCDDTSSSQGITAGNGNGRCNDIDDSKNSDFEDLRETDVIGGNKFISSTFEYRFPISDTLGLMGVVFFDTGNAFAEGELLFDVTKWRYGTGVGVQWFSPFGPLAVILGFPLDKLSVEDSPVFEFSVGGRGF
jgi:outer membrane protein assembly factor BamA